LEVRGARRLTGLHHRAHRLAPTVVGDADHERVVDVGVGLEDALHLFGEDLLSTGVDAGRAAAEQGDRAVFLEPGEVARHHVAAAIGPGDEGGCGLLRVLVVPDRDVAAAGQAADLAGTRLERPEGLVEHHGVPARRHGRTAATLVRGLAL